MNSACVLLFLATAGTITAEPDLITGQEEQLVTQLRPLVSSFIYKTYMNETSYLVRFLRVRNHDLGQAADLVKETMTWRLDNKMDAILLTEFNPALEKQFPVIFDGVDNYNRQIVIGSVGMVDVRKIALSGQLESFINLTMAVFEFAESVCRQVQAEPGNGNVTRGYFIFDLAGFNLRRHWCAACVQYIPVVFNILEKYYPDRMYRIVNINTPRAFLPFIELIRPFLSQPTQKAIRTFDYDTEKWKKLLLSEIPENQLPVQYGGSRVVQPGTLSYLKEHNKYFKAAVEEAKLELVNL